jgi:2-oxoglutarate dehydrogenase E1 component
LDRLLEDAGALDVDEIVMGMAHRGRLNVLANVFGKPFEQIFAEFEGALLPRGVEGDGNVKYHLGYHRLHVTGSGTVVEGLVRAKQRKRSDKERQRVLPVLIHGDAAFTGQGVVYETLALSQLPGYRTWGDHPRDCG